MKSSHRAKSSFPLFPDLSPIQELVKLRWWAIISQALALGLVTWLWEPGFPLKAIFSILGFALLTNLVLGSFKEKPGKNIILTSVFTLDVVMLTGLLALSGGPANPFSMLFLLHVILAAVMTNPKITWFIVGLSSAGFALLFLISNDLPTALGGHGHHGGDGYSVHLKGMWVAYTICAAAVGVFVTRMSTALLEESEKRQKTARLFGLATLAAGAAHEIGNPLGTIRLAASELENNLMKMEGSQDLLEDVKLINDEVLRASEVLKRLQSSSAEISGEPLKSSVVGDIIQIAVQQVDPGGEVIVVEIDEDLPQVFWPSQATSQVFAQLFRNAMTASDKNTKVILRAKKNGNGISIEIIDEGCGMTAEVFEHVGQPFFTTREGEGMGLGVFIANSLTEHLGGTLRIVSTENEGTRVLICLPIGLDHA